jgi:hypothetical protein
MAALALNVKNTLSLASSSLSSSAPSSSSAASAAAISASPAAGAPSPADAPERTAKEALKAAEVRLREFDRELKEEALLLSEDEGTKRCVEVVNAVTDAKKFVDAEMPADDSDAENSHTKVLLSVRSEVMGLIDQLHSRQLLALHNDLKDTTSVERAMVLGQIIRSIKKAHTHTRQSLSYFRSFVRLLD